MDHPGRPVGAIAGQKPREHFGRIGKPKGRSGGPIDGNRRGISAGDGAKGFAHAIPPKKGIVLVPGNRGAKQGRQKRLDPHRGIFENGIGNLGIAGQFMGHHLDLPKGRFGLVERPPFLGPPSHQPGKKSRIARGRGAKGVKHRHMNRPACHGYHRRPWTHHGPFTRHGIEPWQKLLGNEVAALGAGRPG